jgi:hypothetical protein
MKKVQGGKIIVTGFYAECGTPEGGPHGFKVTLPMKFLFLCG